MSATDRKFYCPNSPYVDAPQSIGNGVTISAPHMVFFYISFFVQLFFGSQFNLVCLLWFDFSMPMH